MGESVDRKKMCLQRSSGLAWRPPLPALGGRGSWIRSPLADAAFGMLRMLCTAEVCKRDDSTPLRS